MKKLPVLLIVLGIFIFSNCGKDEKCGAKSDWVSDVVGELIYNDYDGISNTRFLIYEDLTEPEDICPDEHVNIYFNVYPNQNDTIPNGTVLKGKAYWGGFYEEEVNLTYDGVSDKYSGEIKGLGLKQAFGEDPAWIGLQVLVNIESLGTLAQDTAVVNHIFNEMYIDLEYHKFLL